MRPILSRAPRGRTAAGLPFALLAACATPRTTELEPRVFAPGVVSTDAVEYYPTFAPDGATVWFTRRPTFATPSRGTILVSTLESGRWSPPAVASFSGVHSDGTPFLAPDGKSLFFSSLRPVPRLPESPRAESPNAEPRSAEPPSSDRPPAERTDGDLWVVRRDGAGWGEPEHLGPRVNSSAGETSPVVTLDGTLWFRSSRPGGFGQGDLWRARLVDGEYAEPENLGPAINSEHGEWNLVVAPDGSFLVFEASGRATNASPAGDLWIAFARADGSWRPAVPLAALNGPTSELAPRLSPDGRRLYFSSDRGAHPDDVDVFSVDLEAVLATVGR